MVNRFLTRVDQEPLGYKLIWIFIWIFPRVPVLHDGKDANHDACIGLDIITVDVAILDALSDDERC